MVTVYAVYDSLADEIYVGLTNNLARRITEHKRGQTRSTKKYKDLVVIYQEEHENYKQARAREKYFKSGFGKEFLRNIIKMRV